MWQAAIGALVGYLFALWWVRRDARKELEAVYEMYGARLDSRDQQIVELRESFDRSQRAVAGYERRARYLESAITTAAEHSVNNGKSAPAGRPVTPVD